jgi:hypothetical protein
MKLGYQNILFENVSDPHVGPNEIGVEVMAYVALVPNGNTGITYSGSKWKKIWNYAKVYKPRDVIRKSFSRSVAEKIRNDKWMVAGLGRTEEGMVWFFHPAAQKYQSFLSLSPHWIIPAEALEDSFEGWDSLSEKDQKNELLQELSQVLPLNSGSKLHPTFDQLVALKNLVKRLKFSPVEEVFSTKKLSTPSPSSSKKGKSAVLFGYGNYARTITLPYLKPYIYLGKVHEIDPSLLINPGLSDFSTNPFPEKHDFSHPVWLIAGFHHTHGKLAIEAMKEGVIPVIEKPIATNWEDYNLLIETAEQTKTPFYQCYQKRYQIYNDFIFKDLNVEIGEPINFKATVFEIPLNPSHWYNWPSSGSRIISNGCHWIDHFLFINNYPDWTDLKVFQPNSEELTIQIVLENGAFGLISLSDIGSNRIGMREYVEFSVPGRRAYVQDSMRYVSESNEGIIREYSTDKLAYLKKMYREIGLSIQNGGKGDQIFTLKSTKLSLELEDLVKSQVPSHSTL